MATIAQRVISHTPHRAAPTSPAVPRRARKSIAEWSDREAGIAAVAVVVALGVLILAIIAGVVLYATTWGYAVTLG